MKIKKSIIFIIIAFVVSIVFTCGTSYAALQSNQATHASPKNTGSEAWIKDFRLIETSSGGLGFTETIDDTTLEPTSESNGIDIHMMKSTEYGGIAILAVSSYGNPTISGNMNSSTGNNTGVMFNHDNWETVAAGVAGQAFRDRSYKYFDLYEYDNPNSAKPGDALGSATATNPGAAGWRGAASASWVKWGYYENNRPYFLRGDASRYGGLFAFTAGNGGEAAGYARGAVLIGDGI